MIDQPRKGKTTNGSLPKVMIVDDEPTNIKILADALHLDYDVIIANNGPKALEILVAGERPHLILLDIMMPGMDGYELCERIKADVSLEHIPIVFLTALTDAESEERGFDVGAVDFITKPIQLSSVRARVRTHLSVGNMLDHLLDINQQMVSRLQQTEQLSWRLDQKERQLGHIEASKDLFESIFKATYEGIAVTNGDGIVQATNPSFTRITGFEPEEVVGQHFKKLDGFGQREKFHDKVWSRLRDAGYWTGEIYNRRKDGSVYPELRTIMAVRRNRADVSHYVTIFTDVSNLRETERRLDELTWRDPVTGLPNRSLFLDQLSAVLKYCHSGKVTSAVLVVDINNFRSINESLGHQMGDEAIRAFADCLKRSLGEDDTLARLSGDEFAILMAPEKRTADDAYVQVFQLARQIHDSVHEPIDLQDVNRVQFEATIGISFFPTSISQTPGSVLQHAETAHHNGKVSQQPTTLFEDEMSEQIAREVALESELLYALERKELVLFGQPQYRPDGTLGGIEFLVRWQHPEKGLLGPGAFVGFAEQSRLIVKVERYIIREALTAIPKIQSKHPGISFSINVSARHFAELDFEDSIRDAFKNSDVSPSSVILELTESVMVADIDNAIAKMNRLREFGCNFSLDDFGTGYSSLSHLRLLPISEIKIDRTFVLCSITEETAAGIVEMINRLGETLAVRIVAEGVETRQHMEYFSQNYPRVYLQGFYFSRPTQLDEWM